MKQIKAVIESIIREASVPSVHREIRTKLTALREGYAVKYLLQSVGNDSYQVTRIAPYDMTEYYWATGTIVGDKIQWRIVQPVPNRKAIDTLTTGTDIEDITVTDDVVASLEKYNVKLHSVIDRS